MSMEFTLLVAYGALFALVEGSGLALAYYLKPIIETWILWIIFGVAIIIGGHLLRTCFYRGKQRDEWKIKILELTESTILEADFNYLRDRAYRAYLRLGSATGRKRIWYWVCCHPMWPVGAFIAVLVLWLALLLT